MPDASDLPVDPSPRAGARDPAHAGEDPAGAADARFAERLAATGARDPREYYRGLLRELRQEDAAAFEALVARYEAEVVRAIASGGEDPLEAWLAFGAALAEAMTGPGRLVAIGSDGRADEAKPPLRWDQLLLHLPDDPKRTRRGGEGSPRGVALPIGLPPELSPAQRATVDLLVNGKVRSPEG